jgi:hypothetical protein
MAYYKYGLVIGLDSHNGPCFRVFDISETTSMTIQYRDLVSFSSSASVLCEKGWRKGEPSDE